MVDPRVEKLADMLINYSIGLKSGQRILLHGHAQAQPLLLELYKKSLQVGAHPFLLPILEGQDYTFIKYANDDQLEYIPEPTRIFFEKFDARIRLLCETNTRELNNLPLEKLQKRAKAYGPLMDTMLERSARGEYHWTGTLYPTQAHAMEADMSLEEYENFVYNACMPDLNDPIGYWKKVSAYQSRLVDYLKGKRRVHVIGKETDLWMNIEGRPFINCDCKENVPDGEIFTSPVENSMEGHVYYSYPAIYYGHEVEGIRLWFDKGRVVKATAEKNEDYLVNTLDTDEGSRYVGEWAIGTNYGITKFTKEILFDEKIGGSFHMAVGAGFPESGGLNKSGVHWDMICDMRSGGEIWVDDVLFYKDGKFVVEV
jgi:aminopeptidase